MIKMELQEGKTYTFSKKWEESESSTKYVQQVCPKYLETKKFVVINILSRRNDSFNEYIEYMFDTKEYKSLIFYDYELKQVNGLDEDEYNRLLL